LSRTAEKDRNQASSFKRTQAKSEISLKSTSSSREKVPLNTSSSKKHGSQCLVSQDELSDTLGPSSDEEFDTKSDDVSDTADLLASPKRKSKSKSKVTLRGKGPEEIKTETTCWMNKLVCL
jgi:hypothetical protein